MGGSKLAVSILGSWQSAPKAARDAYERFVAAVSALLGGEASSEEVPALPRLLSFRPQMTAKTALLLSEHGCEG